MPRICFLGRPQKQATRPRCDCRVLWRTVLEYAQNTPWHIVCFKFDRQAGNNLFCLTVAAIAQLGERQTEDLKVPGSIPGLGMCAFNKLCCLFCLFCVCVGVLCVRVVRVVRGVRGVRVVRVARG